MADATLQEALAWLRKAQRDLDSAERLIAGTPPYRDTASYHCQQAAEKAIKAYLTVSAMPYPKTHDLTALLVLASTSCAKLRSLEEAVIVLTPYATLFRYPDAVMEPSNEDAAQAVTLARQVVPLITPLISATPTAIETS